MIYSIPVLSTVSNLVAIYHKKFIHTNIHENQIILIWLSNKLNVMNKLDKYDDSLTLIFSFKYFYLQNSIILKSNLNILIISFSIKINSDINIPLVGNLSLNIKVPFGVFWYCRVNLYQFQFCVGFGFGIYENYVICFRQKNVYHTMFISLLLVKSILAYLIRCGQFQYVPKH